MLNKNNLFIAASALVILAAFGVFYFLGDGSRVDEGRSADLVACLNDSGALMYGAFWCPHCQDQKDLLGPAADNLNYVECSTPDGSEQTAECESENILNYPTWRFGDGSRRIGVLGLDELAEASGCRIGA